MSEKDSSSSFYSNIQARLEQAARAGIGQANSLLATTTQNPTEQAQSDSAAEQDRFNLLIDKRRLNLGLSNLLGHTKL